MARWLALTLPAPAPGEAILLVEALRRLGARTVEREGRQLIALFPAPADPERLATEVAIAARVTTGLGPAIPHWRWLDPAEWAARWGGGHPARPVSDRLVVVVGESGADDGGRLLRLEPSSAFGTAEHPTTRSCLRMLDAAVREGDRVLDVGAGSGVLAIAAVVLGAASATALEVDPVACAAARRNANLNGVSDRVDIREVAVRAGSVRVATGALRGGAPFDGVVANIGAAVLRPILPDLAAALYPRGWLILSGVIPQERDELAAAARAAGLGVAEEVLLEGWWTGRLTRTFGAAPGAS